MGENSEAYFVDEVSDMIIYSSKLGLSGEALAKAVTEWIQENYQGERITIKKVLTKRLQDEIRNTFNGRNMREVVEQYGVHRATVYRVCAAGKG